MSVLLTVFNPGSSFDFNRHKLRSLYHLKQLCKTFLNSFQIIVMNGCESFPKEDHKVIHKLKERKKKKTALGDGER